MNSDFGLRGPKTPCVCPNDRQLALRAKLKAGWSVKTSSFSTYPKPQPLTEKEQQTIIAVVKKAEEMDLKEQQRVGKLVDRLENLRRLASGNGQTDCVLCGDSFGLSVFGRNSFKCFDCQKAVCRKCVVDLSSSSSQKETSVLRLCKLCSENREFIKKSGAWFFKSVPKYILPEKNNHYVRSYESLLGDPRPDRTPKRVEGGLWAKHLPRRNGGDHEAESSSGEELGGKWSKKWAGRGGSRSEPPPDDPFDPPDPFLRVDKRTEVPPTLKDLSPSSDHSSSSVRSSIGSLELSLLFDNSDQALHCSLHRAKELEPMDFNGLSDPFCALKLVPTRFEGTHLRTKTVHKSLHPVFNETLTFYGVTQHDLARQSLQVNVMDEDKWGNNCLGTAQIPLHRLRLQTTKFFDLALERAWDASVSKDPKLIGLKDELDTKGEEGDWGKGRLLLSLSLLPERGVLIVGIVKAMDLIFERVNKQPDPFFKMRLVHDPSLGPTNTSALSQKFTTSVKRKNPSPEYNEEFTFKIGKVDVPRVALSVSAWHKDLGKQSEYIGGIMLGLGSKGDRLKHWTEMLKVKDGAKKHLQWHTLSPTPLPN